MVCPSFPIRHTPPALTPSPIQTSARFSTYSGAPSLQPSLAPTFDTTSARSARSAPRSNRNTNSYLGAASSREKPTLAGAADTTTAGAANRSSTFYASRDPTAASSTGTLSTASAAADPKAADIRSWSKGFERMQDERLDRQRYVMSGNKSDEVSKLALGAKLDRALGRRMTGQDASFTPANQKRRLDKEKVSLDVECR